MLSNDIEIRRVPCKNLSKDLGSGKIISDSWLPHMVMAGFPDDPSFLMKLHFSYAWDIPTARSHFGKSDGYFLGEWRYSVYMFEAKLGELVQKFILWCDPKKAGKGSSMELVGEIHRSMIPLILLWLSKEHPNYKTREELLATHRNKQ